MIALGYKVNTVNDSLPPSNPPSEDLATLRQLYSGYFKACLATASANVETTYKNAGWVNWNPYYLGKVYLNSASGRKPLYQLWSGYFKDYFYTTDQSEKTEYVNAGWIDEGVKGYVLSQANSQLRTIPLYRIECASTTSNVVNHYFYISNNYLNLKSGCRMQKLLGYSVE
jgi:hypothetical protein